MRSLIDRIHDVSSLDALLRTFDSVAAHFGVDGFVLARASDLVGPGPSLREEVDARARCISDKFLASVPAGIDFAEGEHGPVLLPTQTDTQGSNQVAAPDGAVVPVLQTRTPQGQFGEVIFHTADAAAAKANLPWLVLLAQSLHCHADWLWQRHEGRERILTPREREVLS